MKNLQLVLTNPCKEQWNNIERPDGEHYCSRCEKNIIDLTSKTDAELLNFFRKKNDNVCGRLLASQLNRKLVMPPTKIRWHWLMPLALGAIVVSPAYAQQMKPQVVHKDQTDNLSPVTSEVSNTLHKVNSTITGKVIDSTTGNPLKGVKIRKKGYENVLAITDANGSFEFSLKEEELLSLFIFDLVGYTKVENILKNDILIKLNAERRIMLGGISTVSLDQKPLYLVYAGKKSCTIDASKLTEISPDWIEKIEVLKDAKATAIYGVKGANGVILIEIKKAYIKKINFSKK